MSTKSGIRSLVCDPNGIIVAEMVYRCMICSAIHDVLDDAQRHYQTEHIDDNDSDLKNQNNMQNMVPLDSDLEEEEEELSMSYDMSDMFEDVGQNNSNTVNVSVPGNLRQLQYQSISNANSDSLIMSSPSMDSYNEPRAKPITFAQPSNSFLLPFTENVATSARSKPSPKRIGGGFVTCEVCGLTKYYSHISRRYGVFSCESCAKFFYRYLLKPSKFTCPNNGACSLKIDVPGGRCKSCLLQACLQKYIIDPKKHPKIFQKPGDKSGTNSMPGNVQIKINKPKHLLANNKSAAANIKQEISADDKTADDQVMPALTTPKPSTNGIVIKATPASGSGKRKQQFNEDGTAVTRSRRIGCRECPGCLADDCGQCLYCLDKPKFGGNDVKKQRCIKRRCHRANYT